MEKNDFYDPQWDFGFGLSYTNFEYSNLKISSLVSANEDLEQVDVKNIGKQRGKEVVQLYLRDHFATISPPLKKLKDFQKLI